MPQPSYPSGQDRDWPLETEIESGSLDSQADRPNRQHFLDAFRALWGVVRARGRPGGVAALAKTTSGNDVAGRVPAAQIGRDLANGVAPLNAQRKVPVANLPDFAGIPVGGIVMYAGEYGTPDWDWAFCDGRWLRKADYPVLASRLRDRWLAGAAPRSTEFRLPDLQGRVPMGAGRGAGLSARWLGGRHGAQSARLTAAHMPEHRHHVTGGVYHGATGHLGGGNSVAISSSDGSHNESYVLRGRTGEPTHGRTSAAGASSPTAIDLVQPSLVMRFAMRTR